MSARREMLSPQANREPCSDGKETTAFEEIIQIYLRDVDWTLIRENLALTPGQRLQKLEEFVEFLQSAKRARHSAPEIDRDAKSI